MFRFTRKPSSGSHRQYLAKITHLVQCGYVGTSRAVRKGVYLTILTENRVYTA